MTTLTFLIYGLACFRLAVLLSEDSGPYRMFTRLRSWLKREAKQHSQLRKSALHEGVQCIRCDSVWFALLLAIFWFSTDTMPKWLKVTGEWFVLAMALSACAILFNRMFPKR